MLAWAPSIFRYLAAWLRNPQLHGCGCLSSALGAIVVVMVVLVLGEYTKTRGLLLLTAVIVGGYFLLAFFAATAGGGVRPGPFVTAGLASATAAMVLMLVGSWASPGTYLLWKTAGALVVFCFASAFCGRLLGRRRSRPLARGLAGLTVAAAVLAVVGFSAGITAAAYWWAFVVVMTLWVLTGLAAALLATRLGPGES